MGDLQPNITIRNVSKLTRLLKGIIKFLNPHPYPLNRLRCITTMKPPLQCADQRRMSNGAQWCRHPQQRQAPRKTDASIPYPAICHTRPDLHVDKNSLFPSLSHACRSGIANIVSSSDTAGCELYRNDTIHRISCLHCCYRSRKPLLWHIPYDISLTS